MIVDFSSETMESQWGGTIHFKCWKKRTANPEFYTKWKHPSNGVEIKTFSGERTPREFASSKPTLKEWLKESL